MLKSLRIRDFTAFKEADLKFAEGLNVIVGANGTGKTHLLKLPYAVMAMRRRGRQEAVQSHPPRRFCRPASPKKSPASSARRTASAALCTAKWERNRLRSERSLRAARDIPGFQVSLRRPNPR